MRRAVRNVGAGALGLDEARDNLAEALALHFEDEDVDIGAPPVIVPIDIAV